MRYKQLLELERAFRTLKCRLSLMPFTIRKTDCIEAYVIACWLTLILVPIAEGK